MNTKKPNKLLSIFAYKCPGCRRGKMYKQPYILPIKTMLDMPDNCEVCNQKMELESGFYFGTGYVSYAMSVAYLILFFAAYHLCLGISVQNNSVIHCLIAGIITLILLQPWMMRISRVMYLYIFVKYHYTESP